MRNSCSFNVDFQRLQFNERTLDKDLIKMEIASIFCGVKIILMLQVFTPFSNIAVLAGSSADVSLDDLKEMGAHCEYLDSCDVFFRDSDELGSYTCDCKRICVEYNTCCVDSEFRNATLIPSPRTEDECLPVYGRTDLSAYMIDKCKNKDIPSESLCESSAEENNDPFLMIPVTSTVTGKTYKNYFCAVCNENTHEDQLVFWNINLIGRTERIKNYSSVPDMLYDTTLKSWVVLEEDGSSTNVSFKIGPGTDLDDLYVRKCKAMTTTCPKEWKDVSVKEKCEGNYMARIGFNGTEKMRWYKNPHCALCNFEDISKHRCEESLITIKEHIFDSTLFVKLFVLTDRRNKCGAKFVYDRFAKKCRCNSRESFLKDGKCVSRT
ncbi:uncharacterized protein TNIN_316981 [Trichonephila inaurata madagascariensis]|uniref:SMB domain-containing protein n=1 Tax=Trichonephila inaurata madagascariensis TaxID=2747483 RepID=A0A8X6X564_9ARAC|nr:uncharacterized protein TNIN_316981 [Trichonephila inaurata madagascariensis]